ncbi:rho-associated protein kinase 1-like [Chaetodon trifascialis]|uniref:rho-associated protein kinase 1-like n=1 Tax=Chaetodon trifascialis TaxID=109706 RepID=UPI0039946FD0
MAERGNPRSHQRGPLAGPARQAPPNHSAEFVHLQNAFHRSQSQINHLKIQLNQVWYQRDQLSTEKKRLSYRVSNLEREICRRDELLKASKEMREMAENQERLQMTVNHLEQQLQQRDTEIVDLKREKDHLSDKLKEAADATEALEEKLAEQLVKSEQTWCQEKSEMEGNQERLQMTVNHLEQQLQQRDTEIVDLTKEKDSLSDKLKEAADHTEALEEELLQQLVKSEQTWCQEKSEMEENQERLQMTVNHLEQQLQQRDTEIVDLTKEKDSLSDKLKEAADHTEALEEELLQQLVKSEQTWCQEKSEMEENQERLQMTVNHLEQQLQQRDTEIVDLTKEKDSLSDTLCEAPKEAAAKKKRSFWSHLNFLKAGQTEEDKVEMKERKKKDKQEKRERKRKEKQERKDKNKNKSEV